MFQVCYVGKIRQIACDHYEKVRYGLENVLFIPKTFILNNAFVTYQGVFHPSMQFSVPTMIFE